MTGLLPRFWAVGASTHDLGTARLSHRADLEDEPTATFLHDVRAQTPQQLSSVLDRVPAVVGTRCRRVFIDSQTPPTVEATLIGGDWQIDSLLQLMLPAAAAFTQPPSRHIRPAHTGDWAELAALFRADHREEDTKFARPVRSQRDTDRVVAARQALPDPVRYFVAENEASGEIVGFVAGWPGEHGHGLVEDLFVRPDHRGHGLATALIAHAIAWARDNGAGPIVIGAEPQDTPKHLYQRLGFIPQEMLRTATAPAHTAV